MRTSHIYPGAHSVNCYLTLKNCKEAIEFYKKAFGSVETLRLVMPDGTIAHAEIQIEGSVIMLGEENIEWGNKSPSTLGGNPIGLSIYFKDVDAAFKKALDAGATKVTAVKDEFYGDRIGQIMDPFGYKWSLATHIEDLSQEEMQSRMDKMFT